LSMLLILSLLASASSLPVSQEKTPLWMSICSGEYLFPETFSSWNDAHGMCLEYGGLLVQIDSLSENLCLLDYAHTAGLPKSWYWHSSNDIESEGVWRQFNDGELISWTPWWQASQPDGGQAANCGKVHFSEDRYAGKWGDEACSSALRYICERTS